MRIVTASIIVVPLLLIGVLPAAAFPPSPVGAAIQVAEGSAGTSDRDTYAQKARNEMTEWQKKLHDVIDKAKVTGQEIGDATEAGLNAAWAKAQSAAQTLQAATADGWESAKSAYETAARDLSDAWAKSQAKTK